MKMTPEPSLAVQRGVVLYHAFLVIVLHLAAIAYLAGSRIMAWYNGNDKMDPHLHIGLWTLVVSWFGAALCMHEWTHLKRE